MGLYDFRGSKRYDILRGSYTVVRGADGDACKLHVRRSYNSRHPQREDVLTIIFDNEAQMNACAESVEEAVRSLEELRDAVRTKRERLRAGDNASNAQGGILKFLNRLPTSFEALE